MSWKIGDVLLGLLLGLIGGMSGYWYLAENQPKPVTIVTVDIRKIIDGEKEKLMSSGNAEEGIKKFSGSLNEAIEKSANGRIAIIKDAVITGAPDITDEVRKHMQE